MGLIVFWTVSFILPELPWFPSGVPWLFRHIWVPRWVISGQLTLSSNFPIFLFWSSVFNPQHSWYSSPYSSIYSPGYSTSHTKYTVNRSYRSTESPSSSCFSRPIRTAPSTPAYPSATTLLSYSVSRSRLCSGPPATSSPSSPGQICSTLPWSDPACGSITAACGCSPEWFCSFQPISSSGSTTHSAISWSFP